MFEDLDDPTPPTADPEALAAVQARGRALRRRRRLATTTGAGATTALVAALLLTLPGGGPGDESLVPAAPSTTPAPTSVPSAPPVPGPTTPVLPPPSSTSPPADPAPVDLELRGDDLGVTAVGEPRAEAVAAVAEVLGPPVSDPATTVDCVGAVEEVAWARFRLAIDGSGRVSGWSSTDPELTTPSGIAAGTTVRRLKEVYGERRTLYPSETEAGDTYTVDGVDMLGSLDGTGPDDRVRALRNGDCQGP